MFDGTSHGTEKTSEVRLMESDTLTEVSTTDGDVKEGDEKGYLDEEQEKEGK